MSHHPPAPTTNHAPTADPPWLTAVTIGLLAGTEVFDPIWVWDIPADRTDYSPAWDRMLGKAPDPDGSREGAWNRLIHPADRDRTLRAIDDCVAGRTPIYEHEYRLRNAEGSWVWLLSRGQVVDRDPGGRALRMIGSVTDITARKIAQEALRRSEATKAALLDAIPDVMFRMNRAGVYLDYHATNLADLAVPPERFMGRNIRDVLPAERAQRCLFHLERLFTTGECQTYEYDAGVPGGPGAGDGGGRRFWEVRLVRAGEDDALLLLREITSRRLAERRLRESEQRLSLLVRNAPFGVIIWNTDRTAAEWNPAAERIFGYPAAEMLGRPFDVIIPRHIRVRIDALWEQLVTNRGGHRSTNPNLTRDGRTITCEWYNTPLISPEGAVMGVASLVDDVTDRLRDRAALAESETQKAALLDAMPDLMFRMTRAGVYLDYHAQDSADLAVQPADFLGRSVRDVLDPRVADLCVQHLHRCIDTGIPQTYEYEATRRTPSRSWEVRMVKSGPSEAVLLLRDVTERRIAQHRQELMMAELDHRVKNNLAAVISLAEQTGGAADSFQDFLGSFVGRLRAMARMHGALAEARGSGADLARLVQQTLAAYTHGNPARVQIDGPPVLLPSRIAQPVAMALNELATNAAKYGSLSVLEGRVEVRWTIEPAPASQNQPTLGLLWRELGGPPVPPPTRRGFGTELIEGAIHHEAAGTVQWEFLSTGVACSMRVPLPTIVPRPALHPDVPPLVPSDP